MYLLNIIVCNIVHDIPVGQRVEHGAINSKVIGFDALHNNEMYTCQMYFCYAVNCQVPIIPNWMKQVFFGADG